MTTPSRSKCYRPVIERFICLASLLRSGKSFTLGEVATRFECSYRTISRDMEFLRDRLGFETEWDNRRKAWRLVRAPRAVLL